MAQRTWIVFGAALLLGCNTSSSDGGASGEAEGSGGIETLGGTGDGGVSGTSTTASGGTADGGSLSGGASMGSDGGSTSSRAEDSTGDASTSGADGDDANDSNDSNDGGDSGGSESGNIIDCPSATVNFEPVTPTVVFLVDQSGSMDADFGGQGERWDVVRDALTDTDGVIAQLEDQVRFGLTLYTAANAEDGGAVLPECPSLTTVDPAVSNLATINATYGPADYIEDTPTGESIAAVSQALQNDDFPGPKIIVLATDGAPDSCECPDFGNNQPCPNSAQATVRSDVEAEVAAAFAAGIQTYVIGVASFSGATLTHFENMADEGVGGDGTFFTPNNETELVDTFLDIINGVRPCTLTLDQALISVEDADKGTVTIDGEVVVLDDENGWRVNSVTEIELLGSSCQAIQTGEVDVRVEFTCGALVPQ